MVCNCVDGYYISDTECQSDRPYAFVPRLSGPVQDSCSPCVVLTWIVQSHDLHRPRQSHTDCRRLACFPFHTTPPLPTPHIHKLFCHPDPLQATSAILTESIVSIADVAWSGSLESVGIPPFMTSTMDCHFQPADTGNAHRCEQYHER